MKQVQKGLLIIIMLSLSGMLGTMTQAQDQDFFITKIKNNTTYSVTLRIREDKDDEKIYFNQLIQPGQEVITSLPAQGLLRYSILNQKSENIFKIVMPGKGIINLNQNDKTYEIKYEKPNVPPMTIKPTVVIEGWENKLIGATPTVK